MFREVYHGELLVPRHTGGLKAANRCYPAAEFVLPSGRVKPIKRSPSLSLKMPATGPNPTRFSRGNAGCPVENDPLTDAISGLSVLIPFSGQ